MVSYHSLRRRTKCEYTLHRGNHPRDYLPADVWSQVYISYSASVAGGSEYDKSDGFKMVKLGDPSSPLPQGVEKVRNMCSTCRHGFLLMYMRGLRGCPRGALLKVVRYQATAILAQGANGSNGSNGIRGAGDALPLLSAAPSRKLRCQQQLAPWEADRALSC